LGKGIVSGAGSLLDGLFDTTIFTELATIITDLVEDIKNLGKTIADTLGESSGAGKIFKGLEKILDSIIGIVKDITDALMEWTISEDFQDVIKLLLDIVGDIFDLLGDLFDRISKWWNGEGGKVLRNIISELTVIIKSCLELIKPILDEIWDVVLWAWDVILEPLVDFLWKGLDILITELSGIVQFVVKIFQGDIKGAFESIATTVQKVGDKVKGVWKTVVNALLGFVENFVNFFIRAINKIIRSYNNSVGKLFDKLGFNITLKEISEISLPRLETGTNEVPYDNMLAVLHKGEAVVPKKYNPAVGGGNSQEMLSRFDRLISLMENQEHTTVVNLGNKKLYQEQKKYNKQQYNKYGTLDI
jgi:phage-related protein